MKISYLITFSTETTTLKDLLERIYEYCYNGDEIILLHDSDNVLSNDTKKILSIYSNPKKDNINFFEHSLSCDYSNHKNFGIEKCKNSWIFQLDGDELPPINLLYDNIHSIIESNPEVELIFCPRINDYKGVTSEIAQQWGWTLTNSNLNGKAEGRPLVNWHSGDFQGRLFKNDYPRIHWEGKLHERISGHTKYSFLPKEEDYALYHNKSIESQISTNILYNKLFTKEENMGHKII